MDVKISEMLKMQRELAIEKNWIDSRTPENAPYSVLWSIEELGEAIAIMKKKGADNIMNNKNVREHFIEELADTFMFLVDAMNSYSITAEEFSDIFVKKFEKNMGRNWEEVGAMYEKSNKKLIIFDMEGTLVHESEVLPSAARLIEVLTRTDLKLAVVSDFDEKKIKSILESGGIDSGAFSAVIQSLHYNEAFEKAMAETGVLPEETVVCSSSAVAVKLAKRLGITPAAVKRRFGDEVYKNAGAEYVFSDITELEKII